MDQPNVVDDRPPLAHDLGNGDRDTDHSLRLAKQSRALAIVALGLLVALVIGGVLIGPRVFSLQDSTDITSCRALYSSRVTQAEGLERRAIFDGLIASVTRDQAELDRLIAAAPRTKHVTDEARDKYLQAVKLASADPDAFIRQCKHEQII